MNLAECVKRVQQIREEAWDDEGAHEMEDTLRADFIKHVSEAGSKALREMAKEVLSTDQINFSRWYA